MRVAFRTRIPLIGQPKIDPARVNLRRTYENYNRVTRPLAVIKPGRRLGGAWIDELVSGRRAVSLCAACGKKYGDWHARVGYEQRSQLELTDCDGCGTELSLCYGYYASLKELP